MQIEARPELPSDSEPVQQVLLILTNLGDMLLQRGEEADRRIQRLEELAEALTLVLNHFSLKLLEKGIHEALEEYIEEQSRKQRFGNRGGGGFEITSQSQLKADMSGEPTA